MFVHIDFPSCSVNRDYVVLVIEGRAKIAVPNVVDLMSLPNYTHLETKGNHRRVFTETEVWRRCWYSTTVP